MGSFHPGYGFAGSRGRLLAYLGLAIFMVAILAVTLSLSATPKAAAQAGTDQKVPHPVESVPVPSPTPTSPPPTATHCAITFTDVDPYNPFYIYIRCLACRGIVSGFADGTFRPYTYITRGQATKIIAIAASFNDVIPSTRQTFTDVPYSSPYWLYVERVYAHGVMSGYVSNPPCTTGVPCFATYNNITRGQIAKAMANAAGFVEPVPSTTQTYADVPYSNPFWVYIERLASRGIISGYDCGSGATNMCTGLLETCDAAYRPYFRSCLFITRGQAAKVVANTFFPGCSTPVQPRK